MSSEEESKPSVMEGMMNVFIGALDMIQGTSKGCKVTGSDVTTSEVTGSAVTKSESFQRVGTVSALYLYPVKSCAGIRVREALADRHGLSVQGVRDRNWMLVGRSGNAIHQRMKPLMALISPSFHGDELHLDAPNMSTLTLSCNPQLQGARKMECSLWNNNISGLDCGDEAAEWFSTYLKKEDVRLVKFVEEEFKARHMCDEIPAQQLTFNPEDSTTFADVSPYMLLSSQSIESLNSNLKGLEVSVKNFRPNIFVDSCAAYDEDKWGKIRIGNATFRNVKFCDRCSLTTVNPETGIKNGDGEPLKTLKRIRQCAPSQRHIYGDSPLFGISLAPDHMDVVREGDEIFATYN